MSRCVRIFRTECRTECVDAAECLGICLAVQLPAHGQAGLFPEEILCIVHGPVLIFRDIFHIKGSHAEHLSRSLTVAPRDQRSVHIHKSSLLEKLMDRISRQ